MKKFILFILLIFTLIGCGHSRRLSKSDKYDNLGYGVSYYAFNMKVLPYQIDSVCNADGISNNLNDWKKSAYIDFETSDTVKKYMFIKSISNDNECIYVITEFRDSTLMNKRIKK